MLEPTGQPLPIEQNGDDIEPHLTGKQAAVGQPPQRGGSEPSRLARADRLQGGAVGLAGAGLYLYDHYLGAMPADDVDLADGSALVDGDDAVPSPGEIRGCGLFPVAPPGGTVYVRMWTRIRVDLPPRSRRLCSSSGATMAAAVGGPGRRRQSQVRLAKREG